jgi:hypothetical protein
MELSMASLIPTVENIPFAYMKYTKEIWIKASFHSGWKIAVFITMTLALVTKRYFKGLMD